MATVSDDRMDPSAMHRPSPDARPIEAIIGKNIAKRSLVVAPILIAVFALTGGWLGAVSAAIGVAIVVANFVVGGYILGVIAIHAKGGRTFAQDAASCVVNGMPQQAIEKGVIDFVAPPPDIAEMLVINN